MFTYLICDPSHITGYSQRQLLGYACCGPDDCIASICVVSNQPPSVNGCKEIDDMNMIAVNANMHNGS